MSDPTFVAGSLRDLNRPVPLLAMTGWRTRVPLPRPGLVLPVLLVAVGVWGLLAKVQDGWTVPVSRTGLQAPIAVLWVVLVVAGVSIFVTRVRNPRPSWFRWWSLLDGRVEPDGVRLLASRARADDPGVLVRRGEHVAIQASLVVRGQNERTYRYRVVAPGGELAFESSIFMEKLSLEPLDALAARWGFAVSTHGEARRIRRAYVGGVATLR